MKLLAVDLGTITPPNTVPTTSGDPSAFIGGLISGVIQLLLISAFIIALIWMIFAGYGLIFAGDDPKKVSSSWAKIYWSLIGLVIVIGAFAIIKLAETFFGVTIISGGLQLPTR